MNDGIGLAARYSFPPNRKGYCGNASFQTALAACDTERMGAELEKFRAHNAYLTLIARENKKGKFDKDVVEAFWIGNSLLENVSERALARFIKEELFPRGSARALALADSVPDGALPHHSFNALYVHFVTDAVKRSVENYDSCCVSCGKVLSVSEKKAVIRRNSISADKGGMFILKQVECPVAFERDGSRFVEPCEGDVISVHWGMALEKLSPKRVKNLERYTRINIDACNRGSR
jgi:hypothetical protein